MTTTNPSDEQLVLAAVDDSGVLTVTLNRPDVMNAWIPPMRTALFDILDSAAAVPDVRVMVITGAGRFSNRRNPAFAPLGQGSAVHYPADDKE